MVTRGMRALEPWERVRAYGGLSSDFVRAFGFVQANLSSDLEIRVDALVLILDIPSRIHWQIEFNDLPLFTDADNAEREEYGDDSFLYFWNVYPEDIRWGHLESVRAGPYTDLSRGAR